MKDFRRLKVWERAHQLTLASYSVTRPFPSEERFGLASQIRRCSASIAANIDEACGRSAGGDFQRFLQIAMGSAFELDYHFLLAKDLGLIELRKYRDLEEKGTELRRMLAALIRKVQSERDGTP